MSFQLLCNHSITLKRPVVTYDAAGGEVRDFNVIAAGVPATIFQAPRGTTQDVNMRLSTEISHQILVSRNLGAQVDDIVVTDDGRTMLVLMQSDQGGRGRIWCLDCLEIIPES